MPVILKRASRKDRKPDEDRVTSGNKIITILRQLKADHELLSASVPGCRERANTTILGIKENDSVFYLDELSVEAAHRAILEKRKARFECHLQGMELQFTANLRKASSDNGIALYQMEIPGSISRLQRRDSFRLRLSPGLVVPVTVPGLDGETAAGEAYDLSSTGLGLLLKTSRLPSRGQHLTGVRLSLPGLKPMEVRLEVRFARLDKAHRTLRLGARFVGLEPAQQRQLESFVAEQQRKRRRYEPR